MVCPMSVGWNPLKLVLNAFCDISDVHAFPRRTCSHKKIIPITKGHVALQVEEENKKKIR